MPADIYCYVLSAAFTIGMVKTTRTLCLFTFQTMITITVIDEQVAMGARLVCND